MCYCKNLSHRVIQSQMQLEIKLTKAHCTITHIRSRYWPPHGNKAKECRCAHKTLELYKNVHGEYTTQYEELVLKLVAPSDQNSGYSESDPALYWSEVHILNVVCLPLRFSLKNPTDWVPKIMWVIFKAFWSFLGIPVDFVFTFSFQTFESRIEKR